MLLPPSLFKWASEENLPQMICNASLYYQTEMLQRPVAAVWPSTVAEFNSMETVLATA